MQQVILCQFVQHVILVLDETVLGMYVYICCSSCSVLRLTRNLCVIANFLAYIFSCFYNSYCYIY